MKHLLMNEKMRDLTDRMLDIEQLTTWMTWFSSSVWFVMFIILSVSCQLYFYIKIYCLCMISLISSCGQWPLLCVQVSEENNTVCWCPVSCFQTFSYEVPAWVEKNDQIKTVHKGNEILLKKLRAHKRLSGRCFSDYCRCVFSGQHNDPLRGPGDAQSYNLIKSDLFWDLM